MTRNLLLLGFAAATLTVTLASTVTGDDTARRVPTQNSDHEYSRIAEKVPGFGGLFYDAQGVANVYLTDTSRAAEFQRAGTPVKILRGQYDFRALRGYRDELLPVMSRPEVVMLDIDEGRNRVVIGVDKAADVAPLSSLETRLAGSGVPRGAVVVQPMEPIHQLATVQDRVRPVPAGVQIAFGGFVCSNGFNANRAGVAGLVTASHCTNTQGGTEGTVLYQNTNSASNRIGVEVADPTYFTGSGCPAGRRCRFSDSAFYRFDNSADRQFARIARTNGVGSLTISATAPRFTVTGSAAFPSQGQTLNKVGRTTGWSRGTVAFTCANINVSGSNITQLCQDGVNASVLGGDSGSGVFSASTSATSLNATIYGILWGGNQAGNQFIMSAWDNVTSELGALSVN